MSTRINVNIGDGGLVDRNAQQQAAVRQANQQRTTSEKAADEGQRQLKQERTRKGLNPDTGQRLPFAGSSSGIRRVDQEPAANRKSEDAVLLVPTSPYVSYGGTLSGIYGLTKSKTILFSRNIYDLTPVMFQGTVEGEMEFLPNRGPDNASAALRFNPPPGPTTSQIIWRPVIGEPTPPEGTPLFVSFDTRHTQVLRFAQVSTSYDGVGSWVNNTNYGDSLAPPEGEITRLGTGERSIALFSKRSRDYKSATHEFMVNLSRDSVAYSGTTIGGLNRTAVIVVKAEGIVLEFLVSEGTGPPDLTTYFYRVPPYDIFSRRSNFLSTFTGVFNATITVRDVDAEDTPVNPDGSLYRKDFVDDQKWIHCAAVRKIDKESGLMQWSVYINGVIAVRVKLKPQWYETIGSRPVATEIAITGVTGRGSPIPDFILPSIHGYRFTSKALYSGDTFTPPVSVTSFA